VRAESQRNIGIVSIPFFIAQPLGMLLNWLFKLNPLMEAPLTGDQVTLLRRDNIVGSGADIGASADLGVTHLESVEAIVPTYIWRFRPYGQFQTKQTA